MGAHRGRLQVQGTDLPFQRSWAWNQPWPFSASAALWGLRVLQRKLTSAQALRRDRAFARAASFVRDCRARGGLRVYGPPWKLTFQNRPVTPSDARVDIEVFAGEAFR